MTTSTRTSQNISEALGSELITDSGFDAVTKATAKNVTGITKATPGIVTFAAGHGYANGDIIYFSGLTQMTELNAEYWQLQNNVGDTFELAVVYGGASLDTIGYVAAETTGGACAQKTTFTNWTQGVGWHGGVDGAGALTGKAQKIAGTASDLEQDVSAVATNVYRVAHTATRTAGSETPKVGGASGAAHSSADTFTDNIGPATTTGNLQISANATFAGTIDTVSCKQIIRRAAPD